LYLIGFRHPIAVLEIQEFGYPFPGIKDVAAFNSAENKSECFGCLAEIFE
jgi:hypothetical protein